MKVEMNTKGVLLIQAETPVEAFALTKTFEGVPTAEMGKRIIVSTKLDKES